MSSSPTTELIKLAAKASSTYRAATVAKDELVQEETKK